MSTEVILNDSGDGYQHIISRRMTICIIKFLEVIHVQYQ